METKETRYVYTVEILDIEVDGFDLSELTYNEFLTITSDKLIPYETFDIMVINTHNLDVTVKATGFKVPFHSYSIKDYKVSLETFELSY